ncbi:MAG: hypothetical protein QXX17_01950 [Conexivisphaerales archaeon]
MSYLGPGAELVLNRLLRALAEERVSDIVSSYEKYTNHYFFQPSIQHEVPVTEPDIISALEHLQDTGILSGEESQSRYCVECFGIDVELAAKCPSCNSTKVSFGKVMIHRCGFKDLEEAYGTVGEWVCPQCKEGIYSPYEECKVEGPLYKCKSCNTFFETPRSCYVCKDCGQQYEMGDEPYVRIRKYRPTPIMKALKDDILASYKLFDALCDQFSKGRYELKRSVLSDEDETTVYWDAVAKKGRNKFGLLVLSPSERLDIVTAERIIAKKRTSALGAAAVITAQNASATVHGKLRREKIALLNPTKSLLSSESEIRKVAAEIAPELS